MRHLGCCREREWRADNAHVQAEPVGFRGDVDVGRAVRCAWLGRGQHTDSLVAELVQMLQGQCHP